MILKLASSKVDGRAPLSAAAGYSLIEMMVAVGVTTVVMGATMTGLSDVSKGSEAVLNMTQMNQALRTGIDLIERDMLQVGSGLPPGHVINIPSGAGAQTIRLPGPPGTNFFSDIGDPDISAVLPSPNVGPMINNNPTDVLSVLMADNTFLDEPLVAVTNTTADVAAVDANGNAINIATGPDRVTVGQLMMVYRGSTTTLMQVTTVDTAMRRITFADGDPMRLNQSGAAAGNLGAVRASLPALVPVAPFNTFMTRIRMITYYLDATTDPSHPRLIRRINAGNPTTWDNNSGTAVAMDVENLQFRFDLNDGNLNPASVEMNAADLGGTGACAPDQCNTNQIRKVNVLLSARSYNSVNKMARTYHNSLQSQVSLRGMSFVDQYLSQF